MKTRANRYFPSTGPRAKNGTDGIDTAIPKSLASTSAGSVAPVCADSAAIAAPSPRAAMTSAVRRNTFISSAGPAEAVARRPDREFGPIFAQCETSFSRALPDATLGHENTKMAGERVKMGYARMEKLRFLTGT